MKEELGMVLARNEAKRLSERKMDFSNIQEEMEIPLKRERDYVQDFDRQVKSLEWGFKGIGKAGL